MAGFEPGHIAGIKLNVQLTNKKDGWGAGFEPGDITGIKLNLLLTIKKDGWGARIRTWVWRDQNPLPYRLATPQWNFYLQSEKSGNFQSSRRNGWSARFEPGHIAGIKLNLTIKAQWLGCQDSNLGMAGSKPAALPLGDTPNDGGYDGIRTCDPRIMSAML